MQWIVAVVLIFGAYLSAPKATLADALSSLSKEAPMKKNVLGTLLWRSQVGGDVVVAPAITSELVISISLAQSSRNRAGFVNALDRKTGQQRWFFDGIVGMGIAGGVLATPAVTTDGACFGSGGGTLVCLDLQSGKARWEIKGSAPIVVSPVIAGEQVFFAGEDGRISALELETGRKRWTFQTGDAIRATPGIEGGYLIVASWDGYIYAMNMEGTLVWKFEVSSARPTALAIASEHVVFFDANSGDVRAVSFSKQVDTWRIEEVWRFATGQRNTVRPVLAPGLVCFANPDKGLVTCVDITTGVPKWTATLGNSPLTPVVEGQHLVVANRVGQISIFDLRTGSLLRYIETGVAFDSAPSLNNSMLFIGGLDQTLYAFALELDR
jgi:outer membrane protein assembly factor BamB